MTKATEKPKAEKLVLVQIKETRGRPAVAGFFPEDGKKVLPGEEFEMTEAMFKENKDILEKV